MLITNLILLDNLENFDIENGAVDVLIRTDEGLSYFLTFVTPAYLISRMEQEKSNFYGPRSPVIIVRRLTKEIIEETLKAFVEHSDKSLIKVYHFANLYRIFDPCIFDLIGATFNNRLGKLNQLEKLSEFKKDFDQLRQLLNLKEVDQLLEVFNLKESEYLLKTLHGLTQLNELGHLEEFFEEFIESKNDELLNEDEFDESENS